MAVIHPLGSRTGWCSPIAIFMALCVIIGAGSTDQRQTFLGIGLDDTASEISTRLERNPGISNSARRLYGDGSVEQRFQLQDGIFIRAVFADAKADETAQFISFDGGTDFTAHDSWASLRHQLGPPTWKSKRDDGPMLRQIWGGKGLAGDAIRPDPNVAMVVELIIGDGRQTLTMTRPSWFQGRKTH